VFDWWLDRPIWTKGRASLLERPFHLVLSNYSPPVKYYFLPRVLTSRNRAWLLWPVSIRQAVAKKEEYHSRDSCFADQIHQKKSGCQNCFLWAFDLIYNDLWQLAARWSGVGSTTSLDGWQTPATALVEDFMCTTSKHSHLWQCRRVALFHWRMHCTVLFCWQMYFHLHGVCMDVYAVPSSNRNTQILGTQLLDYFNQKLLCLCPKAQCPTRCLWPTSFDPQYSKHKFEVMMSWQNHRAWFQKNDYHKIKIICINKKFTCFFISIDSVSKSWLIFQKKKKKIKMGSMACERNENKWKKWTPKTFQSGVCGQNHQKWILFCFQCKSGLVNTQSKLM
jgi:hypothetical protein